VSEELDILRKSEIAHLCETVSSAIQVMSTNLIRFNRGNSDTQESLMVVGAEKSPFGKLRVIAGQVQSRQMALVEARSNVKKKIIEAKIKRRDAEQEADELKRSLLEIEAEELEAQVAVIENPYKGALESVIQLKKLYDKTVAEIVAIYGEITDEVLQKDETRYWVKRLLHQSLCDMRECGRITKGEQMALSQIGMDPTIVQQMLSNYIQDRLADDKNLSTDAEELFLERCADKFSSVVCAKKNSMEMCT
jgi:hypothetical protein